MLSSYEVINDSTGVTKATYRKTLHPMVGDPLWPIRDVSLATTDGGSGLMELFISEHRKKDAELSFYNTVNEQSIIVNCSLDDMPGAVSAAYHLEKGTPLSFIGWNSITDCYVVGMTMARGRISSGHVYQYENGTFHLVM